MIPFLWIEQANNHLLMQSPYQGKILENQEVSQRQPAPFCTIRAKWRNGLLGAGKARHSGEQRISTLI